MLNRKQLLKDIIKKTKTNFYADLLTVWFSVINANVRSVLDLLDENIFDNPLFLIYLFIYLFYLLFVHIVQYVSTKSKKNLEINTITETYIYIHIYRFS